MIPQYVNQPKPGKKLGNVKTTDGKTYFFDPAEFMFTAGSSYNIETRPMPFKDQKTGEPMLLISKVLPNTPQAPATPSVGATPPGQPAEFQPADAAMHHAACIFMSGAVNHAIAAGKVEGPAEIRAWASGALMAFYEAFKDKKKLDDDIPY